MSQKTMFRVILFFREASFFKRIQISPQPLFNATEWDDVTADINDLGDLGSGNLVDTFWEKADLSLTNTVYWDEIAHANGRSDFDSNYWQEVAPGMTRMTSPVQERPSPPLTFLYGLILPQLVHFLVIYKLVIAMLLKMVSLMIAISLTMLGLEVRSREIMFCTMVKYTRR